MKRAIVAIRLHLGGAMFVEQWRLVLPALPFLFQEQYKRVRDTYWESCRLPVSGSLAC